MKQTNEGDNSSPRKKINQMFQCENFVQKRILLVERAFGESNANLDREGSERRILKCALAITYTKLFILVFRNPSCHVPAMTSQHKFLH